MLVFDGLLARLCMNLVDRSAKYVVFSGCNSQLSSRVSGEAGDAHSKLDHNVNILHDFALLFSKNGLVPPESRKKLKKFPKNVTVNLENISTNTFCPTKQFDGGVF